MRDRAEAFDSAGATIVAVGCGPAVQAGRLRDALSLPFEVYADPDRESFEAAGLRRDIIPRNPLQTGMAAMRAFLGGARQGAVEGDPWQLGGTFALAPGGTLLFEHRSAAAGDHASAGDVLAALQRA